MEIGGYAQQRETLDAAFKAEEESRRRIEAAAKYTKVIQEQAQDQIQHIKDEYTKQLTREDERAEQEIVTHRTKNYERLRNSQLNAKKDLEDTRRSGERELSALTHGLESRKTDIEKHRTREIGALQNQAVIQISDEENKYKSELGSLIDNHRTQMEVTRETEARDLQQLQQEAAEQILLKRQAFHEEKEKVSSRLEQEHKDLLQDRNARVSKLYNETEKALTGMRADFSEKLDLLRTRYNDDFYRLKRLELDFGETDDEYVVSLPTRADEQNQVSTALKGQTLVVTVKRQFDDREQLEPGRLSATSQYQSVQEAIELPVPVNPRSLSKSYENGEVVIRVFKKTGRAANLSQELQLANKKKDIEARLAREEAKHLRAPKFPKAVEAATKHGNHTAEKSEDPS